MAALDLLKYLGYSISHQTIRLVCYHVLHSVKCWYKYLIKFDDCQKESVITFVYCQYLDRGRKVVTNFANTDNIRLVYQQVKVDKSSWYFSWWFIVKLHEDQILYQFLILSLSDDNWLFDSLFHQPNWELVLAFPYLIVSGHHLLCNYIYSFHHQHWVYLLFFSRNFWYLDRIDTELWKFPKTFWFHKEIVVSSW